MRNTIIKYFFYLVVFQTIIMDSALDTDGFMQAFPEGIVPACTHISVLMSRKPQGLNISIIPHKARHANMSAASTCDKNLDALIETGYMGTDLIPEQFCLQQSLLYHFIFLPIAEILQILLRTDLKSCGPRALSHPPQTEDDCNSSAQAAG